jgi:hypothetical protein
MEPAPDRSVIVNARLARNGDVEGFRAYVCGDEYPGSLEWARSGTPAMRYARLNRGRKLCAKRKLPQRLVKPKPIDAKRVSEGQLGRSRDARQTGQRVRSGWRG